MNPSVWQFNTLYLSFMSNLLIMLFKRIYILTLFLIFYQLKRCILKISPMTTNRSIFSYSSINFGLIKLKVTLLVTS